ncbi:AAA family ATPase [Pedobacter sp. Leaf41]|uniref:AAA family ATPase n=1 Tax=Pedobacter sp. Leaf41 TaxID=1736218 RepID=UPI000A8BFD7F|nr:AAA family ATPase [Pedobacter sp. Leaf41]
MEYNGYILSLEIEKKDGASHYPFNIPSLQNLESLEFHPAVTFFTGDNGVGKSTLIEAIAVNLGFNAEGGSKNFNFSTKETHSDLHSRMKITKSFKQVKDGFFLRSESFYNLATVIDSYDRALLNSYGGVSLHEQSHGESFWAIFKNRFKGNGLYILDEPESALSATRQLAMLSQLDSLVQRQSQFIIVTHSPLLLSFPNAVIYEISEDGLNKVAYKETEVYRVYKSFLDSPERAFSLLF